MYIVIIGGRIPIDGFEIKYLEQHITSSVFIIMSVLSAMGALIALIFLSINFTHRKLR